MVIIVLNEDQSHPDCSGSVGCPAKRRVLRSQSGHVPGLRIRSWVGAQTRGNRLMYLSHIDISSASLSPSLRGLSLKINK